MTDSFHKFPSTPHIAWLSPRPVRGDKVLAPAEVAEFLAHDVLIEEKIDGANLGISIRADGSLSLQNRGNRLEGKLTGQWERLRGWSAEHATGLRDHLPREHVLFGEWCFARHSIAYDRLPDWFLAFDIYDTTTRRFWSAERRDSLLGQIGICSVPQLGRGRFTLPDLKQMLDTPSSFSTAPREGIYLRQERSGLLVTRAKLVRPEFVQQIAEHWSKGLLHANHLVGDQRA